MEENLEQTTVRIENENSKGTIHREEFGKRMKILEGILDTREQRNQELIREYLNDAPVRFRETRAES